MTILGFFNFLYRIFVWAFTISVGLVWAILISVNDESVAIQALLTFPFLVLFGICLGLRFVVGGADEIFGLFRNKK